MSGKRFQSRAKTVQKLGRDGLVEQNMATGEEKRVSQRTADISFGPARPQEQAAGHRAVQRSGGDSTSPGKKRRKQPRPVQQTAEEAAYATPAPTSVPEAPMPDTPSMRMAADAPMMAAPIASEDPSPPPASRKRRKRKNRKKSKQRQAAKHTPNAARSPEDQAMRAAGDAPMQNRPPGKGRKPPMKRPLRPVEGGGRLQFKDAEGPMHKPLLASAGIYRQGKGTPSGAAPGGRTMAAGHTTTSLRLVSKCALRRGPAKRTERPGHPQTLPLRFPPAGRSPPFQPVSFCHK